MTRRDEEMFRRVVEAAAALAAAVVVQRGAITDAELHAMPMVRSEAMADAVRSRLLKKYKMRVVALDRSRDRMGREGSRPHIVAG